MVDANADDLIFSSAIGWNATPSNYSSMRFIRLRSRGFAELTYAYGQTNYAVCECKWSVPTAGVLRLTELAVTGGRLKGYEPSAVERDRVLSYVLIEVNIAFEQPLTSSPPWQCRWSLELSEPPWPAGLNLPYNVPRVFYGADPGEPEPPNETASQTAAG